MPPPTSAPVSAPTPIQRSCESIRGQIENDGAQLLDRNWKTPNQTVSSSATGPDYNCKRKQELVYPKQKVLAIMDRQTIQDICSCKCGQRGCCSLVVNQHKSNSQYLKDAEIDEIFDHYRLTLAFLLMAKNPMLIFKVKEPGMEFTDNRLQKRPLSDEEATELLDFSPTRKTPIAIYQLRTLQHQFFMPNLSYSQQHHEINPERILPISVEKPIGCGASSVVYKGSILPGYHDFPDIGKEVRFRYEYQKISR